MSDELDRGYYGRSLSSAGGQRNGYRVGPLDSAEGAIDHGVPQVRRLEAGTLRYVSR